MMVLLLGPEVAFLAGFPSISRAADEVAKAIAGLGNPGDRPQGSQDAKSIRFPRDITGSPSADNIRPRCRRIVGWCMGMVHGDGARDKWRGN